MEWLRGLGEKNTRLRRSLAGPGMRRRSLICTRAHIMAGWNSMWHLCGGLHMLCIQQHCGALCVCGENSVIGLYVCVCVLVCVCVCISVCLCVLLVFEQWREQCDPIMIGSRGWQAATATHRYFKSSGVVALSFVRVLVTVLVAVTLGGPVQLVLSMVSATLHISNLADQ